MRRFWIGIVGFMVASVAQAQTAATPAATNGAAVGTTASGGASSGTGVPFTLQSTEDGKISVGFDPKAKRDPNGKLITEDTKPSTEAEKPPALRDDRHLRSDADLFAPKKDAKKSSEAATSSTPASPAPPLPPLSAPAITPTPNAAGTSYTPGTGAH